MTLGLSSVLAIAMPHQARLQPSGFNNLCDTPRMLVDMLCERDVYSDGAAWLHAEGQNGGTVPFPIALLQDCQDTVKGGSTENLCTMRRKISIFLAKSGYFCRKYSFYDKRNTENRLYGHS